MLFSYAVLRPLHYLTEIAWLHERNYFTTSRIDYPVLVALAVMAASVTLLPWFDATDAKWWQELAIGTAVVNFVALGGAYVATKQWSIATRDAIYPALVAVGLYAGFIAQSDVFYGAFAVLLPTLIHVALFTAAFLLLGALRNSSPAGSATLVAFALAAGLMLLLPADSSGYVASAYARVTYDTTFGHLQQTLQQLWSGTDVAHAGRAEQWSMLDGFARFLAFAYTYHYLNWFSKTSVIGWHRLPRRSLVIVGVIWVMALVLYAVDYQTGVMVLFLLSALHVYLEFPLNWRCFGDIRSEIRRRSVGYTRL